MEIDLLNQINIIYNRKQNIGKLIEMINDKQVPIMGFIWNRNSCFLDAALQLIVNVMIGTKLIYRKNLIENSITKKLQNILLETDLDRRSELKNRLHKEYMEIINVNFGKMEDSFNVMAFFLGCIYNENKGIETKVKLLSDKITCPNKKSIPIVNTHLLLLMPDCQLSIHIINAFYLMSLCYPTGYINRTFSMPILFHIRGERNIIIDEYFYLKNLTYKLTGVTISSGSHATTYVYRNNRWYYINSDQIIEKSYDSLFKNGFFNSKLSVRSIQYSLVNYDMLMARPMLNTNDIVDIIKYNNWEKYIRIQYSQVTQEYIEYLKNPKTMREM